MLDLALPYKLFAKLGQRVLYVNSVCLNPSEPELARGGAIYFHEGTIEKELPAGDEGILVVEIEA